MEMGIKGVEGVTEVSTTKKEGKATVRKERMEVSFKRLNYLKKKEEKREEELCPFRRHGVI